MSADHPILADQVIAELQAEIDRLRAWKAEATAVIERWDALYDLMGRPGVLGESRATSVLNEMNRLRAENETLRSMHAELSRRIEVLTEWQREACEWFRDYADGYANYPIDLLRRAGVEVDG